MRTVKLNDMHTRNDTIWWSFGLPPCRSIRLWWLTWKNASEAVSETAFSGCFPNSISTRRMALNSSGCFASDFLFQRIMQSEILTRKKLSRVRDFQLLSSTCFKTKKVGCSRLGQQRWLIHELFVIEFYKALWNVNLSLFGESTNLIIVKLNHIVLLHSLWFEQNWHDFCCRDMAQIMLRFRLDHRRNHTITKKLKVCSLDGALMDRWPVARSRVVDAALTWPRQQAWRLASPSVIRWRWIAIATDRRIRSQQHR